MGQIRQIGPIGSLARRISMEVEIFALCDAATEYGGKLNILGTFDRIGARQFPVAHPHCSVAIRLRFERIEEGDHRVRITVIDTDGRAVVPGLDGNIGVKFPSDVPSVCANIVLNIGGMKFEKPGRYSVDLAVDGRQERSLPIDVVHIDQKPPQTS
jgi:hypothetical protein